MTKGKLIPISKSALDDAEMKAIKNVSDSGMLAQGKFVESFEESFADYIGTKFAIATNSGTSALHTALASLGLKEGDEIITTTFSFIATASCILMQNAKPVFVDINQKTYNIEPHQIEQKITERTKAIIPVHLYGQPCDIDKIIEIAKDHNIFVIEDAAQAHGAEYKGKKVGGFGDAGIFSFYPTKNMTTGEGGMVITNSKEIAEKARMIRNHGQKQRYVHETLGFNYRMTNIAAAIGIAQLKKLDGLNERRMRNAEYYNNKLEAVEMPFVAEGVKHVFHQYTVRVKNRERFFKYLEKNEVGYGIYYPIPIHKQPLFKEYNNIKLERAEKASEEVVSIPVHPALRDEELKYIVEVINIYAG